MRTRLAIIFSTLLLTLCALPLWSQTTTNGKTKVSTGYTTQSSATPQAPVLPDQFFKRNQSFSNSTATPPPGFANQLGTNMFGTNSFSSLQQDVIILSRNLQADVERLRPLLALLGGGNASWGTGNDFNNGTVSQTGQNFGTVNGTNLSSQAAGQNLSSSAAVPAGGVPAPPVPTIPGSASPSVGGSFAPAASGQVAVQAGTQAGTQAGGAPGTSTQVGANGAAQLSANDLAVINEVQVLLQDVQANSQQLLPRLAEITANAGFQNNAGGAGNQFGTNSGSFNQSLPNNGSLQNPGTQYPNQPGTIPAPQPGAVPR
ncbi:MAG: hypothetical protein JWQ71_1103 [Pedosphaera sp.]|nr:hypothetical protein [Pedosphaera sp.]